MTIKLCYHCNIELTEEMKEDGYDTVYRCKECRTLSSFSK